MPQVTSLGHVGVKVIDLEAGDRVVGIAQLSVFVASAPSKGRGKLLLGTGAMLGVAIVAFATSTIYWVTLPIMIFLGFAQAGRIRFLRTMESACPTWVSVKRIGVP